MDMLRMDTARRFGCVLPTMEPGPRPWQRGTKVFFHQALQDRKLLAIPGIHYFDAHRLPVALWLKWGNWILGL